MDNALSNCLPITGHSIPECNIDAPFIKATRRDFDYAGIEYDSAAEAAVKAGRDAEAKIYTSIGIICSFAKNFDSISEPYQPRMRWEGKRSIIPDDLTLADLDIIAQLRVKAVSPLLRARFGDILWVRRKDHVAAKEAAGDYISAANTALTKEDWFFAVSYYQRGLQLSHRLGRKNESWKLAEEATVAALRSPLAETEPHFASHFLGVLEKMGGGDFPSLAELAKVHAEKAASEGDARRSRIYHDHEARFWSLAKDADKENVARLASAMTYEAEALQSIARTPPSYFAASDALAHGIEALRRAHADPAVVERLKVLLKEYQKESLKELKTYTHEVDLSGAAEQAAKLVEHSELREALKYLVFSRPLTSPDEVRAEVLKQVKDFPISQMFGGSVIDRSGRVTGHIGGLMESGEDEAKAVEARMFRHAAEYIWNFRAAAFIEPARRQIWFQHTPQQSELDFLVINNPFVPPGHEGIFLRGLYYGLCGDMLLAAHLLAPQLENSIRYVLEQNGIDVSNLESDLTQPVKTLGPLMTLLATTEIFGPECVFELRGLLIEKLGYSFRHRVAHGFVAEGECYGPECSNLWWLTLRLCYTPFMRREQAANRAATPPA